jgi:hypothetical protein
MTKDEWYTQLFELLGNSKFRSNFHLKQKDIDLASRHRQKGAIVRWTMFSTDRAGRRDHPVFIAQHAPATCCRERIRKWHKIQPGRDLSEVQQDYLVDVIMTWIEKEYAHAIEEAEQ